MSRMVILGNCMCGCCLLLDGEEETPLLSASTRITKYLELSASLPGPTLACNCSVVPPAHVGNKMMFDLSALSLPNVRYPMRQSFNTPFSSLKSPSDANCCCCENAAHPNNVANPINNPPTWKPRSIFIRDGL